MTHEKVKEYLAVCIGKTPQEILRWVCDTFAINDIALATGMGAEGQVLTDMLMKIRPNTAIFTIDTGYLHDETLELITATEKRYGITYEVLHPKKDSVAALEAAHKPEFIYESLENRKKCCFVRKVEPLTERLKSLKAWICGLRREQGVTRQDIEVVEWDAVNGLVKINPLALWSYDQVWEYVKANSVPYNSLHDQGYLSIGCRLCTRAVKPGEHIRAGRWWWEKADNKECGLHRR